jgi:hypothetical protein
MAKINLKRNKATRRSCHRVITPEEYDALMSELTQVVLPESPRPVVTIDERFRRIEFNLMILIGLILIILTLYPPR